MNIGNVFDDIPKRLASELFEDLLKTGSFRLERIVSLGHSSPEGDWYDQQTSEWIYIVEGSAGLLFEGSEEETVLQKGDYVNIPAHTKHRVEWTAPDRQTIWLAIHY